MEVDVETDDEFWTSLNLISTQGEEESGLGEEFQCYIAKSSVPISGVVDKLVPVTSGDVDNSLPITTIISRIQAEESESDPELDDAERNGSSYPPPSYTGGKWKPSGCSQEDNPSAAERLRENPCEEITINGSRSADCDYIIGGSESAITDLTCFICDRTFSKLDNLLVHLTSNKHRSNINSENNHMAAQLYTKYHTELLRRSAYQCACCTFAATEHEGLVAHMKSQQHNENASKLSGPLECVSCKFLDYNGTRMLAHCMSNDHKRKAESGSIVVKEKKSQIECLQCNQVLHSTIHYKRHVRNKHSKSLASEAKTKQCDYCGFSGKLSTVNQHVSRTHRNKRPNLCKLCVSDFHSKYDLVKHYSTKKHIEQVLDSYKTIIVGGSGSHTRSGSPPLTSSSDGPLLTSTQSITSNEKAMICKYCRFTTSNLLGLQNHYVSKHSDEYADDSIPPSKSSDRPPPHCRYCLKQVVNNEQLYVHEITHVQRHMQLHSSLESEEREAGDGALITCFICFSAYTQELFQDHLLQHNPYKKRNSVTNLQKTNSSIGSAEVSSGFSGGFSGRHHCAVEGCGRSYKTKGDLTVHMAGHTGESVFTCDECSKRFTTRKQLKAHKLSHSSLTPFSCDYCNYRCKTRCYLLRHMRIHAGSRPYSCPHCEYSATTIGNLRKHILSSAKHKGLPMYECREKDCQYTTDTMRSLSEHLVTAHHSIHNKLIVKSTENDWTEIIEGHSIISLQH